MAVNPNNPIANPNVPLSGPALIAAAHALANAQTSGPLAALATQIAQNNAQNRQAIGQVGGYFGQLGNLAQQGVTDQGQTASALNDQLAQIAKDEQGTLGQVGQDAQASLARYSPQASSNTVNPGLAGLATEMARQQGIGAQQQGAFRAYGATQGANFGNLAASNLGTTALRGQEDLTQLANAGQVKNEPLMAQTAAQLAARGADYTTALGKLRQQEITNQIADAGVNIKQTAATTAAKTAAFNANPNAPGSPANARVQAGKTAAQNANTSAGRAQTAAQGQAFNENPAAVGSAAWQRVQSSTGTAWSQNVNAVGSPAWARVQTANRAGAGSGGAGGGKPLSTLENNHFWGTIGQLEQLVRNGQQPLDAASAKALGMQQGQVLTEQQLRGLLQSGQNPSKKAFDPFFIQVAYELLGYGRIDSTTAATLHNQYGVRGGTYNGQPIRVTPAANPVQTGAGRVGNFGL